MNIKKFLMNKKVLAEKSKKLQGSSVVVDIDECIENYHLDEKVRDIPFAQK